MFKPSEHSTSQEAISPQPKAPGFLTHTRVLAAAALIGIAGTPDVADAKDSACISLQGGAKAACNACETDRGTFANFQCTKPVVEIAEVKPPVEPQKKKPKTDESSKKQAPTTKPAEAKPVTETIVSQNETCTPDPESADHDMLNKKLNAAIGLSGLAALLAALGLRRRKEENANPQRGNDIY